MKIKTTPYKEILELFEYCKEIGLNARLERLFDGHVIRFDGYGDIIQHEYSYGSKNGCVEPAIGSELDYTAVSVGGKTWLLKEYATSAGLR